MAFRTMQSLLHSLPKTGTTTPFSGFIFKSSTAATTVNKPLAQSFAQFSPAKLSVLPKNCQIQQPLRIFTAIKMNPLYQPQRNFHLLTEQVINKSILSSTPILGPGISNQTRTVTKFSLRKGTRKTVKAVVCRFYRLDWGIWIHPRSGRHKKLWKKGKLRRKRLRLHVFTNAWQTRTLERMTTKYWHKKKYWVDDPYEPYHKRDNFAITKNTRNIYDQLI